MISEGYIPRFTICTARDSESDSHAAKESIARICSVAASHRNADTKRKGSARGE